MSEAREQPVAWLEPELRNFVGHDLKQQEARTLFRGPVKRVSVESYKNPEGQTRRVARIYLDWLAVKTKSGWRMYLEPEEGEEEKGVSVTGLNLDFNTPYLMKRDDGSYTFYIPYVGAMVEILKQGDRLRKEDVLPKIANMMMDEIDFFS